MAKSKKSKWLNNQNPQCKYCGYPEFPTVDHIIPTSRGGENTDDNFQVLCYDCNNKKSRHTDTEIAQIFTDIQKNGVRYKWEEKYETWLTWIKFRREIYKLDPFRFKSD